jgi:hypothetical protein
MEHLEARQINASNERLVSEAAGEIEPEDNLLVIRRMHVRLTLTLKAPQADWEAAGRGQMLSVPKSESCDSHHNGTDPWTSSPTVTLPA